MYQGLHQQILQLQIQEMGQRQTSEVGKPNTLLVATFNYGEVFRNPFEVFLSEEDKEFQRLSQIFKEILPSYITNFDLKKQQSKFKWNVGRLHQIQDKRYSPLNPPKKEVYVGIRYNEYGNQVLMNKTEFQNYWNKYINEKMFGANKSQIQYLFQVNNQQKKQQEHQQEDQLKQIQQKAKQMRTFDLVCYHSIIKYLSEKHKEQIEKQMKESKNGLNQSKAKQPTRKGGKQQLIFQTLGKSTTIVQEYKKFLDDIFKRQFIHKDKRFQKFKKFLSKDFSKQLGMGQNNRKLDVVFVQDPEQDLIKRLQDQKELEEYLIEGNSKTCLILIRKSKFKHISYCDDPVFQQKFKPSEWALMKAIQKEKDQATILICDNLLLVGIRFNGEKNQEKIKAMKQTLRQLHDWTPSMQILFAGDMRSFVSQSGIEEYYRYPVYSKCVTTSKKKTYLQLQYQEANLVTRVCQDFLISSERILKMGNIHFGQIENDDIKVTVPKKNFLLPNNNHPFEHLVVMGQIQHIIPEMDKQKKENN